MKCSIIKKYDIAKQNGKYGIIVEEDNELYFKDLYLISGITYKGNVLEQIQEDILKVDNEAFIKFLLCVHPRLKNYIVENKELKHLITKDDVIQEDEGYGSGSILY